MYMAVEGWHLRRRVEFKGDSVEMQIVDSELMHLECFQAQFRLMEAALEARGLTHCTSYNSIWLVWGISYPKDRPRTPEVVAEFLSTVLGLKVLPL